MDHASAETVTEAKNNQEWDLIEEFLAGELITERTNSHFLPLDQTLVDKKFRPQPPHTQDNKSQGAAPLKQPQLTMPLPLPQPAAAPAPLMYLPPTAQQTLMSAPQFHIALPPFMYVPQHFQQSLISVPQLNSAATPLVPTVQQPGLCYHQAAPDGNRQVNSIQMVSLPQGLDNNMGLVAMLNGQSMYSLPPNTNPQLAPSDPSMNTPTSRRRKFRRQPDDKSAPYVKKPPNAFMLYRKEQRAKIVTELGNPDCGVVNKVIGERWKSLSKQEQDKYYEEAEREKQRHLELYPEWSARENYGMKKKRIRRKEHLVTEEVEYETGDL